MVSWFYYFYNKWPQHRGIFFSYLYKLAETNWAIKNQYGFTFLRPEDAGVDTVASTKDYVSF